MQKAVLGQVVRRVRVCRQLAQEISDLRLVPANELAKRRCVLCGYDACDKLVILRTDRVPRLID
jgi:hypothetical protein